MSTNSHNHKGPDPRPYQQAARRAFAAASVKVSRLWGVPASDPRVAHFAAMETDLLTARAELTALSRVLTEHLQADPGLVLDTMTAELQGHLDGLQQEAGISGWDGDEPVLVQG